MWWLLLTLPFIKAPESMKAVLQALYLLTTAGGNLIDIVVVSALSGLFNSQVLISRRPIMITIKRGRRVTLISLGKQAQLVIIMH